MPEHRIRLRGAWDLTPPGVADPTRVDLPTVWGDAGATGPIRLARRFGRLRFDPLLERVDLELVAVPGLRAIRLNGRDLSAWSGEPCRIELGEALQRRNLLELDIDLEAADRMTSWGAIALVISPRAS